MGRKEREIERLERIATVMDAAFPIPGTGMRVGIDSIIGLVPGVGDLVGAAVGIYVVWQGAKLGASRWVLVRMLAMLAFDAIVGVVPVLGDLLDIGVKSHVYNVALLRRHLQSEGVQSVEDATAQRQLRTAFAVLLLLFFMVLVSVVVLITVLIVRLLGG
jgi:hypothetical protein